MGLSFRTVLLSLSVGLLLVTVLAIGALTLFSTQRSVDRLGVALQERITRGAADKLEALLAPARAALLENRTAAARGLLPLDDQLALSERLVDRLRHEPTLTWLSYGDEQGRFTGAWRREDGAIIANRSWIGADGRGRLIEELVSPEGRRETVRTSEDWRYDPRQRPFYALGRRAAGVAWTPPYEWWDGKGLGITATLANRRGGTLEGVFTADLHLSELSSFLDRLTPERTGRVYIVARDGTVIAGPSAATVGTTVADPVLAAALARAGDEPWRRDADRPLVLDLTLAGREYGVGLQPLGLGDGIEWAAVSYVPADELFGFVRTNLRWTLAIGGLAMALALILATVLSLRVTRRLDRLAEELEAVGRFELEPGVTAPSRIREIRLVSEAADRMKAGLRSFSRYVPPAIVRDLVVSAREAALGVERQTLTVFFSDVEGFSRLCTAMPPDQLVEVLSGYFSIIEQTINRHGGTLDKFMGDGVIALFNAPAALPDHAAAACETALDIVARLRPARAHWEKRGKPPTRTRIGLHTGPALVGNLGTPTRFQYTAVGGTVNFASRLQLLNKVYRTEIIASQTTHDAAGPGYEWRRLDRVRTTETGEAEWVYELLDRRGVPEAGILDARDRYEWAMDRLVSGDAGVAAQAFARLTRAWPGDRATQVMLARAEAILQVPGTPRPEIVLTRADIDAAS
jgi:adenylate cyclase